MDTEIDENRPAEGPPSAPHSVIRSREFQVSIAMTVVTMLVFVLLVHRSTPASAAATGSRTPAAGARAAHSATPAGAPVSIPIYVTPTPTPTPSVTPTPTPTAVSFASAVGAVVSAYSGHGAVMVTDLTTGASASYLDDGHLFDTGSIVKVDILATLLYQNQQAGRSMTSSEQSYATTMIENSNNDSANALFNDDGDVPGLTAANRVFGLTGTTVNDHWGDTTTDPAQQMLLLKQVFTADSVLTPASRDYIQGLMSKVESDQRWGVSAAASPGTSYLLKNGWLPSSATGLWTINSIGEVTDDGHTLLIATQSDGGSSMDAGVTFVQQLASTAANSLLANE
jgi:hypothetical protein